MSNDLKAFQSLSYQANENHYHRSIPAEGEDISVHYNPGMLECWRSYRLLSCLDPLLTEMRAAKWVTIGDGKWGKEAFYIQAAGVDVVATDIDVSLLESAKKRGFIREYRKENAEKLSFADNSFDFILCKESLHHFPRPMLALYEMLRVARVGVVLIEPRDKEIPTNLMFSGIREYQNKMNALTGHKDPQFEPCGNFIYGFSERELEKVALGIGLHTIAFRGLNDYYFDAPGSDLIADKSEKVIRTIREIELADALCENGVREPDYIASVIFCTDQIPKNLTAAMVKNKWQIKDLPRNPYLDVNGKCGDLIKL